MKLFRIVVVFFSSMLLMGCRKPAAEGKLDTQLINGSIPALEKVLQSAEKQSAEILFTASGLAYKEKRLEDSAFLFYAAGIRTSIDKKCFPPKKEGGDSPFVAYSALAFTLGGTINPAIGNDPKKYANVCDRLAKWNPDVSSEYAPSYEFTERLAQKEASESAQQIRDEVLSKLKGVASLLNDPEYFAASQAMKNAKSLEETKKASETMKRIEKEKNVKGVFSK